MSQVTTRHIVTDPRIVRQAIHQGVLAAITAKFPIDSQKYLVELHNPVFKAVELPHQKQKDILMSKGNATDALFGDLKVVDKSTGKEVAYIARHRIVNVPFYTTRYSMIIDGNEYSVVNQMRTKPGVYTRKRGNDEIEASFNLAKGANFKLLMEPVTGLFKISMLGSTVHAYGVLKILGASSQDIIAAIGEELYKKNAGVSDSQVARAREMLFSKVIRNSPLGDRATNEEKDASIREYFAGTVLDEETTRLTLGTGYTSVTARALLDSMSKILRVFNEEGEVDERDNVEFQKIYSVEDILKEVLEKNSDAVMKLKTKLNSFRPLGTPEETAKAIKDIFSPVYFSKPLRNFVTTSSISRLPGQINPMEIMDTAAIVTRLGEGAIASEDAVPDETRQVNYSYMGVIDPIATPESSKVGIDNRVTIEAMKGSDNEFYKKVRNTHTGQLEIVKAINLYDKYVGFPDSGFTKPNSTDIVPAVYNSKMVKVPRYKLDYQYPSGNSLLTHTTASIPFVNAIQGNRAIMGDKHVQQALPLKDADKRLVATVNTYNNVGTGTEISKTSVGTIGAFMLPKSPVDGEVTAVDSAFIHVKDSEGEVHKVDYVTNLPLATKTLLNNNVIVKVGDKVTAGQSLADSNFTKDDELAMGKNLRVAYMPYYGMNHEDGVVISEDAAKKLTSVHSDKVTMHITNVTVIGKDKFSKYFPTTFTADQLKNMDADGVVTEGTILHSGDPIIVAMEDDTSSKRNLVLGMLHRSLIMPHRDVSKVYDLPYPAEVLTVQRTKSLITVLLKIEKPMQVGDKIAGSYGNKGVVTRIVPTDQVPHDMDGNPVDVMLTPVGVIGRINPAQILETALGKVALKTGKRYDVENFAIDNYTDFVSGELKKHNVKDKEDLVDPGTGKVLKDVFVGVQHMHKLFKTTDTNYAARGVDGPHDADDSPTGSGDSGPKALGGMEVNALLAHNSRNILKESTMLRGSKNTDFWRAFQSGYSPNFPTEKKTFTRFSGILRQAGIKLEKDGDQLSMGPLTDNDILEASSGEIADAKMLAAKSLLPEDGGLFDPRITGGLQGTKWAHIELVEPMVNPVFEDAVKSLLGLSTKELGVELESNGGEHIKRRLNGLDIDSDIVALENSINNTALKGSELDKSVKKLKYLKALQASGLKAGDAYVLTKLPVTPPIFRPVTVSKTGDTMNNDANTLYRDIILQNNSFKGVKETLGTDADIQENRSAMYSSMKELTGVLAPSSPSLRNRGIKGALEFISGDSPKYGFFQRKVIYGKMNLSGRATIVPDQHLDLDEIGLPEKMAWELYKPFIIRELVQTGYSAMDAREEADKHSDAAKNILLTQMEKRPVLFNRAPTLHRHNLVALKPTLRDSKNLHINSIIEKGLNADYDGDACTVHLPVSDEAIQEAWNLVPSKQVFTDKKPNDVIQVPTNEPIVGLYRATQNVGTAPKSSDHVHTFSKVEDAWAAYYSGKLKMTDFVRIG